MKTVLIRTDASFSIGTGHVMRCLTIAKRFQEKGYRVKFWSLPLEGNMNTVIEQYGFDITQYVEHVDILIVDHYQLDIHWEKQMRQYAKKIMVIDDLANREHDCDLLLDQNVLEKYETRYEGLVPDNCKLLLGASYLIMRDEFIDARQYAESKDGNVKHLLVFMGGSDPTSETMKVLQALSMTTVQFERIDVVVGKSNPNRDAIKRICEAKNYVYHCQIDYLATLMKQADFAIGAGGLTMWERCYVGLPSSSTIVAENQRQTTQYASQLGAVIQLGWHEAVTAETYLLLLEKLPTMQVECEGMRNVGLAITGSNRNSTDWINEMVGLLDDKNWT